MAFRKLICNLLLGVHPGCTNKWMHPICAKSIHKYYLNYETVYLEYRNSAIYEIENINDLLIYASIYNIIIIVKWCLKNKTNVRIRINYALPLAAQNGNLKIVKLLLAAGEYSYGINDALKGAAERGHINVVQLLLAAKADIHANNDAALRYAAQYGHLEVIKLLLADGANIQAYNNWALRHAVYNGHLETVRLLLDNGADIHTHDRYVRGEYDNPLPYAIRNNNLEMVNLLQNYK